jgi:hypothetical protein
VLTQPLTLFFLVVALVGVSQAVSLFKNDLLFTRIETEVSFWGRGDYQPEPSTILATAAALNTLVAAAPDEADYLALQASYFDWRAYWAEEFEVAGQFSQRAVDAQYLALEFRPAHRSGWAALLRYASRTADGKPTRSTAKARLSALEPAVAPR